MRWDILGVVVSNLVGISFLIGAAAIDYYLRVRTRPFGQLIDLGNHTRSLLWLGVPFIPNILLTWALSSSDRWLLAYLDGLESVGIYALADTATQVFQLVVLAPLSASYIPQMLRAYAEKKNNFLEIEHTNIRTMWYAMGIAGVGVTLATCGGYIVGPYILPTHYLQSLKYVWLILLGNVFFMGTYFNSTYLVYSKRIWLTVSLSMSATLCNVVLNCALIPIAGIMGCTLATTISNALFFVLHMVIHRRLVMQSVTTREPIVVQPASVATNIEPITSNQGFDKETNDRPNIPNNP